MRFIEVDKKLTEEVVNGMKRTEYYLDGNCEFAMLSDNVFVVLKETKVADGLNKVRKEVNRFIDKVLSNHPDFNTYLLDDGYTLVTVYGVYAFERDRVGMDDYDNPVASLKRSLMIRNELLEACENRKIIAIAAKSNDNN